MAYRGPAPKCRLQPGGEFRLVSKLSILALGVLALAAAGCSRGGASSGDTLALVNGDPITVTEFHEYLERKPTVQVITSNGPTDARVAGTLGLQALRDLINRRILLQIAKDEGVAPNSADIQKELTYQTKRNPAFVKTLNASGLSLDEIRSDLALDLARFNVVTHGITVTQQDVDNYIKQNPSEFVTPATVDLYWIVLRSGKNKPQVDQDLKAGQAFPVVATRYSEAPNAQQMNGAYPVRAVNELNPKLKDIVDKLKPGQSSDWIPDGQNWVKFFLQNRTAETKVPIDDTVREQVRRQIAETRGQQANDLGRTLETRLKAAKIDVKKPALRDAWVLAMRALREQNSTAAGAAGTGAGTAETTAGAAPATPGK